MSEPTEPNVMLEALQAHGYFLHAADGHALDKDEFISQCGRGETRGVKAAAPEGERRCR